ncbi:trigger factor [Candidatus Gracilibacteria bacterium]|nr:trigger factor [Candidatus Gracilibacteria bacterium]
MAQAYKTHSGSKVSFTLTIEEKDMIKAKNRVIEQFKKEVEIKGFRKGHAPNLEVISHVGAPRISYEALNVALDSKYREFIKEHGIKPVDAPDMKLSDSQKMPIEAKMEVEVFPEITLGDYKKIKLDPIKVEIKDKEVDEVIENIMKELKIQKTVKREAKDGDLVEIDFEGKDKKGETIPNTKGEKVLLKLGSGQFLEDLEKAYVGMKAGEEKKEVKVKFPKNYPAPDMAGKTIPFDIKVHSVGEVSVKDLDEEMVGKITGQKKKVGDFKKEVITMLEQKKRDGEKRSRINEYNNKLEKLVKADLPVSWIDKEVGIRMGEVKQSPQYKHDPENFWKAVGQKEDDLKKKFKVDAEKNLKVFLGLSEIATKEKIDLNKDEIDRANHIVQHRAEHDPNLDREAELHRVILNLKIDKYLEALMM